MKDNYFAKTMRGELTAPRSAQTFQREITRYDVDAGTARGEFRAG